MTESYSKANDGCYTKCASNMRCNDGMVQWGVDYYRLRGGGMDKKDTEWGLRKNWDQLTVVTLVESVINICTSYH